jgi:hypothetical protein
MESGIISKNCIFMSCRVSALSLLVYLYYVFVATYLENIVSGRYVDGKRSCFGFVGLLGCNAV